MLKKISLMLFGLLLGLLLIEGSLQLFSNWLPEGLRYRAGLARFQAQMYGIYGPDPYLWQKSLPGIDRVVSGHPDYTFRVQTNSLGFEDIGFRDDGFAGRPAAIALGDSFTWGDGVDNDQTWVAQLEAHSGQEIVNMGMSGYGSIQRLRILEKYGLALQPKLILWSFFPNDFYDDGHFAWREETGRLSKQGEAVAPPGLTETIDRALHRVSVAYNLVASPFGEPDDEEEYERLLYPGTAEHPLNLTFVLRPYWQKRLDPNDKYVAAGVELTRQALITAQAEANAAQASLVVILFPSKEQAYWPVVATLVDRPETYHLDWPMEEVKAWCQAQGIAALDLTPVFQAHAAQGEQLYFRFDAHWNEAGHALAAQAIQQYLARQDPAFTLTTPPTTP